MGFTHVRKKEACRSGSAVPFIVRRCFRCAELHLAKVRACHCAQIWFVKTGLFPGAGGEMRDLTALKRTPGPSLAHGRCCPFRSETIGAGVAKLRTPPARREHPNETR